MPRPFVWSAVLCALLMVSPAARAQADGRISGRVAATDGTPVSGARVSVLNTAALTATDADGRFTLGGLAPGALDVSVQALGYAAAVRTVRVAAGETATLDLVLASADASLGEAIVTAEKTETQLQRTPAAISALSARQLQDARAWSITDLTALAPSLFVVEHGNSAGANFFNIRGTLGFTAQQAVATYVDGVYQFDFFSAPLDFNNVERIEVLRGPQGTLYGRNAFSGVVNIVTKRPTNTPGGYAEIDAGSYGRLRLTGGANVPLVANRLFANVSAQANRAGSVYSNPTRGTDDFDGYEAFNVTGGVRYLAGERWQLDLTARTQRDASRGAYAWVASDSLARNAPYTAFGNWDNEERRANTNASASVSYFGRHVTVQSVTSAIDFHSGFPGRFDFDFTAARLVSGSVDVRQNQFTQEVRLSSSARDARLRWTAGAFLFTDRSSQLTDTFFDEDFAAVDPAAPYQTSTDSQRRSRGAALFGQATVGLAPRLDLTAGTRLDVERREITEATDLVAGGTATPLADPQTDAETFRAFTPKLTASYQLTDRALVYASYARGFRVGGFNVATTDADARVYGPETSNNVEAAVKTDWFGNRLRTNVTAFYLQQRDQQVTTSANGVDYFTLNVGDMNNLGLELEVAALPVRGLVAEWTASFSRARYARLDLFDAATNAVVDYAGNRPIYNPAFSSMVALQYTQPVQVGRRAAAVFARVEQRLIGRYALDFVNTESESGYALWNTRVGARAGGLEVALWGRNVTGAQYLTWGSYGSYMLGRPASFGLTLTSRL